MEWKRTGIVSVGPAPAGAKTRKSSVTERDVRKQSEDPAGGIISYKTNTYIIIVDSTLTLSCGPVVVMALAIEANTLAGKQGVGDQGDGHFRKRLQGAVRAGDRDFEDGLGHVISLGMYLLHRL